MVLNLTNEVTMQILYRLSVPQEDYERDDYPDVLTDEFLKCYDYEPECNVESGQDKPTSICSVEKFGRMVESVDYQIDSALNSSYPPSYEDLDKSTDPSELFCLRQDQNNNEETEASSELEILRKINECKSKMIDLKDIEWKKQCAQMEYNEADIEARDKLCKLHFRTYDELLKASSVLNKVYKLLLKEEKKFGRDVLVLLETSQMMYKSKRDQLKAYQLMLRDKEKLYKENLIEIENYKRLIQHYKGAIERQQPASRLWYYFRRACVLFLLYMCLEMTFFPPISDS